MAAQSPSTSGNATWSPATFSLILGIMALFGLPARLLIGAAGSTTSVALLLTLAGLQLVLAVGAIILGLRIEPAGDCSRRPAWAYAGTALGGLTLILGTILLVLMLFNNVSNSMNPSVIETRPIILQND